MTDLNKNQIENRCYGLVVIRSENSNFNADFTGNARRLPDENGTIYATDKTLKYSIRRFWQDRGKDVFVWRSHLENGNVRTRDERMAYMKSVLSKKENSQTLKYLEALSWLEKNIKIKKDALEKLTQEGENETLSSLIEYLKKNLSKDTKDKDIENMIKNGIDEYKKIITAQVFASCIDTKLFGVTYTGEGPLSLTGPLQISYGINKFSDNTNYINDILSPYPTGDDGATQSSIGKEKKVLESYYVYDFSLNPKNITTHYETDDKIAEMFKLNAEDITDLKQALKYSVTALDTTSKKDSENAILLFVTMNAENSDKFLPAMKNLVKIEKNDNKAEFDLSSVYDLLESKNDGIKKVELFYNEKNTKVIGFKEKNNNWTVDKNL